MKVLLVIHSLASGGAERVMTHMANYWVEHGHEVSLLTLHSHEGDFYPLAPAVVRHDLDLGEKSSNLYSAIRNNLQRVFAMRRMFKALQPEHVITFMPETNIIALLAAQGLDIPVVISERTDPEQGSIGLQWEMLRKLLYRRAAAVVVQTGNVARWAHGLTCERKVHVVPNPVVVPQLAPLPPRSAADRKVLMSMGRLSAAKGFDILIDAFARCASRFPDWDLRIVGEGNQRAALEAQIVSLGLAERVQLTGLTREPLAALQSADLFVLSSLREGFPNVLLEAMSCGLPSISFDCRSGPADIIEDGVNGLLVPVGEVDGLVEALARLMADRDEAAALGRAARGVLEKFAVGAIMARWESVLAGARHG